MTVTEPQRELDPERLAAFVPRAAEDVGATLNTARTRNVVTAAGFSRFRRAAGTPLNIVYEARP